MSSRSSLGLLMVVGACGGSVGGSTDVEPTLVFADRSDAEISRLVSAATVAEGFGAQGMVSSFDDPSDGDPCPAITEDLAANTVTITGGCTTLDDEQIDGTATIINPLGWGELEYDFRDDSIYDFSGFTIVRAVDIVQAWDGVFTTAPSFETLDLDLTSEVAGLSVRSDLFLACDQGSLTCEHGESGLELLGVGGARVSGTIAVSGQSAESSLALRGVDTVRVSIADGCIHWEIEGTGRSFDQGTCP